MFLRKVVIKICSKYIGEAVTLALYSIYYHFIRNIRAKFCVPNLPQSPDIMQNTNECIYDFLISGHSLIKLNCYNSRTSDDIDMKLGPVTKLDKRKKATSKKFDENLM